MQVLHGAKTCHAPYLHPCRQKKTRNHYWIRVFILKAWQFPTFAWQPATLSSALRGFTSEFGMGSGGSLSLCSPSKLVKAGARLKVQGSKSSLFAFFLCLYFHPTKNSLLETGVDLGSCSLLLTCVLNLST